MIDMVLAEHPELALNTLEIDRAGPSYTIDSLLQIRGHGDEPLALLLGTDAFNGFASWKQPQQILELAHLVVCIRPGVEVDPTLYPERRVDSAHQLQQRAAGAILLFEADAIDCSSSEVRAALAAGDIPRQWLHSAVADYIHTHHLYRRSGD